MMKRFRSFVRVGAVLLTLAMMLTLLTGCDRQAVTTELFRTEAETAGLKCTDVTAQFEGYDFIREATVAAPEDFSYQMEFYVLSDTSYAKSFYQSHRANFEMNKLDGTAAPSFFDKLFGKTPEGNAEYSEENKQDATYWLTAGDRFMYLQYVDNTLIYIDTDKSHREQFEGILKALKY